MKILPIDLMMLVAKKSHGWHCYTKNSHQIFRHHAASFTAKFGFSLAFKSRKVQLSAWNVQHSPANVVTCTSMAAMADECFLMLLFPAGGPRFCLWCWFPHGDPWLLCGPMIVACGNPLCHCDPGTHTNFQEIGHERNYSIGQNKHLTPAQYIKSYI